MNPQKSILYILFAAQANTFVTKIIVPAILLDSHFREDQIDIQKTSILASKSFSVHVEKTKLIP